MKYLRILVILLSLATAGIFGYYKEAVMSRYDKEAPVITADTDSLQVSVNVTEKELLEGMTAFDENDGDVTDSLIVESFGKFYDGAKKKVNYVAFDKTGNVATYTRDVTYVDYESPKFYLSSPLRVHSDDYISSVLDGLSAVDCIDGDISAHIKYNFSGSEHYSFTLGDNMISYQVANSSGDTSTIELAFEVLTRENFNKTRAVLDQYILYTKAGVPLELKDHIIGVEQGMGNIFLFEEQEDDEDLSFTVNNFEFSNNIDYETPGMYRVICHCFDVDPETEEREDYGDISLYCIVEE